MKLILMYFITLQIYNIMPVYMDDKNTFTRSDSFFMKAIRMIKSSWNWIQFNSTSAGQNKYIKVS